MCVCMWRRMESGCVGVCAFDEGNHMCRVLCVHQYMQ